MLFFLLIFFLGCLLSKEGWLTIVPVLLITYRVSIHKTFAKFLQNEMQNFSFFVHQFCTKKQQFAQSFAKVILRKIALFRFCETQVLCNSATRVLRNSAISWKSNGWWRCVFLRIQFWKNLVWECFPIGYFYKIDQWQLRRVQISQAPPYSLEIKILPSFTLSNFYFINFGPLI